MSPEEQARQFSLVVSSYYPPFTLPGKIDGDIAYAPRAALQDPKYPPTTAKMTEDELREVTHPVIFQRLQHAIWSPALRLIYEANAGRALLDCRLLDDGTGGKKKIWPDVKVHLLWCDMTAGEVAWAAAVFNYRHREADPVARRPMEVHKLEGANHFVSILGPVVDDFMTPTNTDYLSRSTGKNHRGLSSCWQSLFEILRRRCETDGHIRWWVEE